MPILKVSPDDMHALCAEQHCAECGSVNVVKVDSLRLGSGRNPDAIALPPCTCGAVEFVIRTTGSHPPGARAHRVLVNALAAHLKRMGKVSEAHADVVAKDVRTFEAGDLLASAPPAPGLPEPRRA